MALTPSNGMVIGVNHMTISKLTPDGYPCGTAADPSTLTVNTVYGAYAAKYINRIILGIVAANRIREVAGGTVLQNIRLPKTDLGTPQFVLTREDDILMSEFVRNNKVDVTTDTKMMIRDSNPGQSVFVPCVIGFHIKSQRIVSGTLVEGWDNMFFLNCQISRSAQGDIGTIVSSADNPGEITFDIIPSLSQRSITGELIKDLDTDNATGFSDILYIYTPDAPLYHALYVDNGTSNGATMPYLPVGNDATGKNGNHVTKNGTQTAITSFSITTGAQVFVSGTSGDKWLNVYQSNLVSST